MPTRVHDFDWPDRVVVGTVGRPGARTFYLQARDGSRVVSVALEKEQSALLAQKIDEILDELMVAEGNPVTIPASTPVELVDNDPLDEPVEAQFRIGAISLGWDPSTAQVVIEAFPIVEVAVESDAVALDSDAFDLEAFSRDADGLSADGSSADGSVGDGSTGVDDDADVFLVAEPEEILQVRIPVGTARAFAKRTLEVVGAGRPLCPRCGMPMDPDGHTCILPDDL
ncbi:hypothetical protein AS850_13295 [Frondihabitans sp. 762G35]|uniref:DUF3090 domain-containing protein n=1 Tax=Frondihabitans sp. 762G35 TaxID=1446794 RepID=UPI000D20FB4C|nr:DUF3090 domain-containing protein [Frondihabitans sp. 762G35]ARC58053.1 hypothetical protein AS850_13295 [Frondihabitans sp. 762G35]